MKFFNLLQGRSKFFYVFLALLALVNSLWASALLMFINHKIEGTPIPFMGKYEWLIYSALIITSFLTSRYFQLYMISLTYNLGNELGLSMFEKLRFADYEQYQKLGEDKIRAAMADVSTVQRFPQAFLETFNAGVMLIIGVVFLFLNNPVAAGIIVVLLTILGVLYYFRNISIQKDLNEARDLANVYHKNVNDFLRGFKEVKMSIERSDSIFKKYITANRNRVKNLTIRTIAKHMLNELIGSYTWYLVIGVLIFALPLIMQFDANMNSKFIVVLLYLMGPTNIVISEIKEFTQMQVALERIDDFSERIDGFEAIKIGHGDIDSTKKTFESITFENVTYEYFDEKKQMRTFRLLPLNLKIRKGEIIFVTGGNGSGKSTFINLLTGLYQPLSGSIYLNNSEVIKTNYPNYRNQIAAIFTDTHLFSDNYDNHDLTPNNKYFQEWLVKMKLQEVVKLQEDGSAIAVNLSKGQQKRLALIYAIMDRKEVIILDEWAAEQDPVFRSYFYRVILQELKLMGKTVVAVTHDDAYFDCAERILKFDFGQIASDTKIMKSLDLHSQKIDF